MLMGTDYAGILCIGDPHLCARVPGFRKDDYPRTSLAKLRWCLQFARSERLVPVLLGDLFHYPRDNANWLLVELMDLLEGEILTVVGNHDCNENALNDDDTLSVLLAAGRMRRLGNWTWTGTIGGIPAAIGGTHWGERLPESVDRAALGSPRFVLWIAHHDVKFPGYEESGRFGCREIAGVDLLVNGHVHRALPDVVCGATTWCNPGNISRVNRGDATLRHVPGVLRINLSAGVWKKSRIDVPHEPFDRVFHPEVTGDIVELGSSQFIEGLAALQRGRTGGGEGLREFINRNLTQFENERVRVEIVALAEEVLRDAAKA